MSGESSSPGPHGAAAEPSLRRQLAGLHAIQLLITAHRDAQEVLDTVVRTTRDALGAVECTIRLRETDEEGHPQMRVAAWAGRPVYARHRWTLEPGSIDDRVIGGEMVEITDMETDPRVRHPEGARDRGLVSMLSAPLRLGAQTIGAIRVYTGERHEFTDDERALLESLAGQSAVAIENARLFHDLQEANARLRASYDELRTTQTELVRSEKLAALGEMSALVAHEIRNPLTAVRGFAQRIQRKVQDQPGLVQACQIIMDEVDRLNRVVVDVLDYARRLEPRMHPCSLNRLVQDVVALEGHVLRDRGIEVRCDCAPDLSPIRADAGQIRQVLLNLIANARHAMDDQGGGELTIRTRRDEAHQVIGVTDTGPGIPADVLPKIFTPFYTTKLRGTGLGLPAAQRIAEDHGGKITVDSTPGEGTTLSLWLPESEE